MGWVMGVDMKSRIESDFAYCEYTILRNLMIMFFLLVANVLFPCGHFCASGACFADEVFKAFRSRRL